ncbi:MAG: hypothetical protein M3337_01800 [Actinomycetota bacterium]|nr:hypothetical protein [Actinomycetota bacterium]
MSDWVWIILTVLVMLAMLAIAFMIEPHWSSKDGHRFICRAQPITLGENSGGGRWREVRGEIQPDGVINLRTRGLVTGRKVTGNWRIEARGTTDWRKRVVYILSPIEVADDEPKATRALVALRMPASSRSAPLLERLSP